MKSKNINDEHVDNVVKIVGIYLLAHVGCIIPNLLLTSIQTALLEWKGNGS